jgi:hypothetical protein
MSDTPRTDAELKRIADQLDGGEDNAAYVLSQLGAYACMLEREIERLRAQYADLILSVGNKYPGESRHETAKRYIHRAEHMIAHEVDAALKEPK